LKDVRIHIERAHFRNVAGASPSTISPFDVHLVPLNQFICPYTSCDADFAAEESLKNHMALEHRFFCAPGLASAFGNILT